MVNAAGPRTIRPRIGRIMISVLILVLLVALLIVFVPVAILNHRSQLPGEGAFGDFAVTLAANIGARGIGPNPEAGSARGLLAGQQGFGACIECHGPQGDGNGVFGHALYPPAFNLTSDATRGKSDAELFWIIQHGLSFTGMPSFQGSFTDTQIWDLVLYIRELQSSPGTAPTSAMPPPTAAQLAVANIFGDAVARGAAVYFAEGCAECHGAVGEASAHLNLQGNINANTIRRGDRDGMPGYGTSVLSDAQLADLEAYLTTLKTS